MSWNGPTRKKETGAATALVTSLADTIHILRFEVEVNNAASSTVNYHQTKAHSVSLL